MTLMPLAKDSAAFNITEDLAPEFHKMVKTKKSF